VHIAADKLRQKQGKEVISGKNISIKDKISTKGLRNQKPVDCGLLTVDGKFEKKLMTRRY
jgi:hypothetical protein